MLYAVVEGPAEIANQFGYFGHSLPAGRYAVCFQGEYANGGRGWIPLTVHTDRAVAMRDKLAREAVSLARRESERIEQRAIGLLHEWGEMTGLSFDEQRALESAVRSVCLEYDDDLARATRQDRHSGPSNQ